MVPREEKRFQQKRRCREFYKTQGNHSLAILKDSIEK